MNIDDTTKVWTMEDDRGGVLWISGAKPYCHAVTYLSIPAGYMGAIVLWDMAQFVLQTHDGDCEAYFSPSVRP